AAAVVPARVVIEYQDRYQIISAAGTAFAQLSGTLLHQARADRLRRPAVGDWLAVRPGGPHDDDMGTIVHLLERRTQFVRQAAGRTSNAQVVAANIDTVFVVTSFNRDFNPRRIERYLATVAGSGAEPVIVLNKLDLCDDLPAYLDQLAGCAPGVAVAVVSARDQRGMDELRPHLGPGRTVALVGSSGVGKSTLINWLVGAAVQDIGAIRAGDSKGRHTTTHRELILMPDGGVLIDTPGMRELQLSGAQADAAGAFTDIDQLAAQCRFRDCTHDREPGCAIRAALADGQLDPGRVASYHKLRREQAHAERRQDQGTDMATRKRWKRMSKAMKAYRRSGNR
ncbi:MAG: ribosome small subunit-dependent GTPase A, partial [Myxococcota bacterium]